MGNDGAENKLRVCGLRVGAKLERLDSSAEYPHAGREHAQAFVYYVVEQGEFAQLFEGRRVAVKQAIEFVYQVGESAGAG